MKYLQQFFDRNREWAHLLTEKDPEFFSRLAAGQSPQVLWIGCSDSRVDASQIVSTLPGEIFVHRNVANLVVHTDMNCLSVIEYAVQHLKVPHIVVCGHYGCGGVIAASSDQSVGIADNWLRHIRDVRQKHSEALLAIEDRDQQIARVCELNVIEQAKNVCHTTVVQNAWAAGRELHVHGWIYNLADGLLTNLDVTVSDPDQVGRAYRLAVGAG